MSLVAYLGCCLAVWLFALAVFALVRHDYRHNGRLTPFSSFLQLLVFILAIPVMNLLADPDWPALHVDPPLTILGATLGAAGLAVGFFEMLRLGLRRSIGRQVDTLRQSGLYRYSRNPQILSSMVGMLGFALAWFSWKSILWVLLLLSICHIMVLTEEEHLRRAMGDEYVQYCLRTPRYIGRLKR